MNKLEVIIRHHWLEDVRSALSAIGVQGTTVTEVRGCGRQGANLEAYRGAEYASDFLPKVKLELTVADELVEATTDAICSAAKTGKVGDGKIFVSELLQVIRIRTGEAWHEAA